MEKKTLEKLELGKIYGGFEEDLPDLKNSDCTKLKIYCYGEWFYDCKKVCA